MLDSYVRPLADTYLSKVAPKVAQGGLSANHLTLAGFIIGTLACLAVILENYPLALILLLINRLCDVLDGAVARLTSPTEFGRYLDIVLNAIFHAGFVFAFAFGASDYDNEGPALFLMLAYVGLTVSALAYSWIAEQTGQSDGTLSRFHPALLIGGTETFLFMLLCCLFPPAFSGLALIFSLLCWTTVVGRFTLAASNFKA